MLPSLSRKRPDEIPESDKSNNDNLCSYKFICLSQVSTFCPILPAGYKMNKIIHKFLLAGDKFIPKMYLRQPSACGPFTKRQRPNTKICRSKEFTKFLSK